MQFDKKLLLNLLSCPTAPYRESCVAEFVKQFLEKEKISYFVDPIGNIVVGADSKADYLKKLKLNPKDPMRFFIAHMDHPGFHGSRWVKNNVLAVKWFGGTPRRFVNGAPVWIATSQGTLAEGIIQKAKMNATDSALETSEVLIKKWLRDGDAEKFKATEMFGAFLFRKAVWEENRQIYTKAADDLVGVFTILTIAKSLKGKKRPFLALLSRAEEVGFIGTIGHLELGWLSKKKDCVIIVSLETSRTLPGAFIGKGPIVRLGDRATPFDPGYTQVLTEIANDVLPKKFQRRIMDGGTCEATAALAFGFRAIGISIPLGNYHNQSFEGGPDSRGEWGPAPEFVHIDDIKGMLTLCEDLMKSGHSWEEPWRRRKESFIKSRTEAKNLLKLG